MAVQYSDYTGLYQRMRCVCLCSMKAKYDSVVAVRLFSEVRGCGGGGGGSPYCSSIARTT
jgi:hypothetical protein